MLVSHDRCPLAALPVPLQLPIMLQQYVEHGGCLFKVYVLGDTYGEEGRRPLKPLPLALARAESPEL